MSVVVGVTLSTELSGLESLGVCHGSDLQAGNLLIVRKLGGGNDPAHQHLVFRASNKSGRTYSSTTGMFSNFVSLDAVLLLVKYAAE